MEEQRILTQLELPTLPSSENEPSVRVFQQPKVEEEYVLIRPMKRTRNEHGEFVYVEDDEEEEDEDELSVQFAEGPKDVFELRVSRGHSRVIFNGLNAVIQLMYDRQFIDTTLRVWSVIDGTVVFPGQPVMVFEGIDIEEVLTIIVPLVNRLCQITNLAYSLNNLDDDSISTATGLLKEAIQEDSDLFDEEKLALQLGGLRIKNGDAEQTGEEEESSSKNRSPLHNYVAVEKFVYLSRVSERRTLLRMTQGDLCCGDKIVLAENFDAKEHNPHIELLTLAVCPYKNIISQKCEISSLRSYIRSQFTVEELLMKDTYPSGIDEKTLEEEESKAETFCPVEAVNESLISQ
jgi:hypothetical protein